MMLEVAGLNVFYGQSHVVQDVSMAVDRGELVCVLGRNGAGKTTILRSIIGLTLPRSGRVMFKGRPIAGLAPSRICRLGLGLVLEDRGIFGDMTVLENLEAARRRRTSDERRRLERLFELFPVLAERRRQRAGTLSGGEQQMLAIARALRNEPELLMLDEPSEGLAPIIVERLVEVIQTLRRELTILLVDQNFSFIQALAERGYVIEKGRVVHEVSIQEFTQRREVIEAYLGVRRRARERTMGGPANVT
jgi:branched-chain amino acid transport system ATP-binding protein